MSDLTIPAEVGATIEPQVAARAWSKIGSGSWVVDGVDLADDIAALDETGVMGFDIDSYGSLTVTYTGGEAYCGGWLCRDRTTDVTVTDNATTDIYVGFNAEYTLDTANGEAPADHDNIIIGPASDFGPTDPRTHIWTVEADGGVIINQYSHRTLRKPVEYDPQAETHDFAGDITVAGNHILKKTQDWDGSSVVYETGDGDTLEMRRE